MNFEMYRNELRLEVLNVYYDVYIMVILVLYVVLWFGVYEMGDINIWVLEYMIDVYGFNIIYEFVNLIIDYYKEICIVYYCFYFGYCIVFDDFLEYKCYCFNNFFGDYCYYGLDCNFKIKINRC